MASLSPLTYLQLLDGLVHESTDDFERINALYDREADVLYVSFSDPPEPADDSDMEEDDILIRYAADGRVVGYTFLNASKLLAQRKAA